MSKPNAKKNEDTSKDCEPTPAEFKAAVDEFERCLLSPVISGELPAWVDEVQAAWSEAAAQIHFQAKHLHPQQYEEIANQDPELLPRIDLLKAEDATIEEQCQKIQQAVIRVAQHAPMLEPDEEKAQKHTKGLIEKGLAYIARVRKQDIAVRSWYVEAFDRDIGAVD